MEEEIEASPTSQKKRKKVAKNRAAKKMSTTGREDLRSATQEENNRPPEDPNCSFHQNILWQSAYLLEKSDLLVSKTDVASQRCNRKEMRTSPGDFLTVSQLCAARASRNVNEKEDGSQWDVTESQFLRLDDAIKEYHESEQRRNAIGSVHSAPVNENLEQVSDDRLVERISESTDYVSVRRNSSKRHNSDVESILSDWSSSSPVKVQKTQSEVVQFSPKFIFNRKRVKRTYCRKQNSVDRRRLVTAFKKTPPATSSVNTEIAVGNACPERCQKPNAPTNVNDDDEDFDESMNIVDNIQNLSKFFSQSCETDLIEDNVDVDVQADVLVIDPTSANNSKSRLSLDDEEDFLGFDGNEVGGGSVSITLPEFFLKCNRKCLITLPEGFQEFDSDSDSSNCTPTYFPTDTTKQLLLTEDDDIFANYQTQQPISHQEIRIEKAAASVASAASLKDGSSHVKMLNGTRRSEINADEKRTEADAKKTFGRPGYIFGDIDREFNVTPASTSYSYKNYAPIASSTRPEAERNPVFRGFSTVSGNPIPVSTAAISEKMNIFEKVNVNEDELKKALNWISDNDRNDQPNTSSTILQENFDVNPNPAFTGFTTARGSIIPVSSEMISRQIDIFNQVQVSEDEQANNWADNDRRNDDTVFNQRNFVLNSNVPLTGFATARGKQIPVSSAMISKKANIFQNVSGDDFEKMGAWISDNKTGETNDVDPGTNFGLNPNPTFAGFTTARGSHIHVSSELLSKKTNIFHGVNVTEDELKTMDNWIDGKRRSDDFNLNSKPSFTGFATARGKQIPVSSAMISKNQNVFLDDAITGDELNNMGAWINENDVVDEANDSSALQRSNLDQSPEATFMGFTTAGGKHMPMPSSKGLAIFDDVNVTADELRKMNHWINDLGQSINANANSTDMARRLPISRSLFSKPLQNAGEDQMKRWNSTDLFREVTNTPQREADNNPKKLLVDTFIRPSPMRKMSMMNSLRKLETLKENVDTKSSVSADENVSVSGPVDSVINITGTPTSSKSYVWTTPTNNLNTYSQIGRESAAVLLEDDELTFANQNAQLKEETPGFVSGFMAELTASSSTPINKIENYRNRLKQRRLVDTFDDIASEDDFESRIPPETIRNTVSLHVQSLRKLAIDEQQRSITKKTDVKAVPSSLYVQKLTSTKVNWKEFVEHNRPVNRPTTNTKLTNNVLNVTSDNASKFKFSAWDHYPDEFCRENVSGIHLHDEIVVMMDEYCRVGLTEISAAFLSCASVDPKLVHDKWIENNMKWIVVKLAAMERSFPHRFAGQVLTLENLMLQLKYRYEREIDLAERSAIRKICEMDDIPEKRMVLFVARISRTSTDYEVELSDGWYSLMSTFDFGMKRLINAGKIKVGTKLVVQGATTMNLNNGCHPLDVPANVRLTIHANSTRRARWDSKLGYCKNPQPFRVSLRSVWSNGGPIVKLRLCILRAYPVVYVDPKQLSNVHSEKVERRRSTNDEREKQSLLEKIVLEVSKNYEEEEKSARYENRPRKIVKLAEIPSITDPAYLCELLDDDKDPERIQGELTNTQKTMVLNYKDKINCLRSEEISARVKEKMAVIDKGRQKFVPLFRFKVTDEMFFDKTAIVTIWKPTEEILSLIKEGSVFDLTGSSARGVVFDELQIYAGKNAIFNKVNVVTRVPKSMLRRHTSISEILAIDQPVLNELDTTGLVIHVGESLHNFQPVYIADCDHNIVCINFWRSVKDFALEDVVQPKRFLAIRNLQWRKSSTSKAIRCVYTTENSIFTESPQSADLSSAITTLKAKFVNIDVDEFIETCMERVKSFNSSCLSTPVQSNISSSLLQSSASSLPKTPTDFLPQPGRSSLSNQSRIELLSKYGNGAMSTPPLNINGLSKSFKLPVTKS